jgi:hypothetical protein
MNFAYGDVRNIDGDVIHGSSANNREPLSPKIDFSSVAKISEISISITDPQDCDARGACRNICGVVADGFASLNFIYLED